jgi:cell division protein FtsL
VGVKDQALEARGLTPPDMHRTINLFLLLLALASAFALYVLKYDTRRMEVRVQALQRTVETLQGQIAALKGRHAHLARPERIEPLARALGLAPIRQGQYLRVERGPSGAAEPPAPARSSGERP